MKLKRKIRVLVVDDSLMFREALAMSIAADPDIEVVGKAADPFEARDKIIELGPDVMTLDVEMPKMNGIEFLQKLMLQYPMPVVVVSAVNGAVFDALNAGAVDFVAKPDHKTSRGVEAFIGEMVKKIKIAARAKVGLRKQAVYGERVFAGLEGQKRGAVIAIGASTGGTEAIYSILKGLPRDIPGILIVQHMPPMFTKLYAERLNKSCAIEVSEAQNKDVVRAGKALIAPGDFHMRLKKFGSGHMVECYAGDRVNGHCPSVDVLFESVASYAGEKSLGIILTGMGADGAKGLLTMKRMGAKTIGQDERTSVIYGMPKVAFDIGAVERQVPLESIPHLIYAWAAAL